MLRRSANTAGGTQCTPAVADARCTSRRAVRFPSPPVGQSPVVRQATDEAAFERWLKDVTERADPFMAWLGIVFALLVGFELAAEVSPGTARALQLAGWAIWIVFALEYAAKLWLAPNRLRFVRRHWLQLAALLVPTLRVFRFLRLVRLGRAFPAARVVTSSNRGVGTARRLARSRLGYLAALTAIAIVALAELEFLFEGGSGEETFDSFGEALLWSAATVLGQQAEPVPASVEGRIAMNLGFLAGATVVAALAATLGAWFVDERRERAQAEEEVRAHAVERAADVPGSLARRG